jgi:hypothetical protein
VVDGDSVCFTDLGQESAPDPLTVRERRRPALPEGFVPVSAVMCSLDTERVPGQGEWSVRVRRSAEGDVAELVSALQVPDERPGNASCTAHWDPDPQVWLLDAAGRAARPAWPRDVCSHLQERPLEVLARVTFAESGRRRIEVVTPQAALDSGCEVAVKNVVGVDAPTADGTGSLTGLQASGSGRACRYDIEAADVLTGTFAAGARLEGRLWRDLVRALAAAGAARPCTDPPGALALIGTPGGEIAYVELDGCRRILTPDGGLRQATFDLVARVRGLTP